MDERQKFIREQGRRMEQFTAGLNDLESVLTAKQQKAVMKRRKDGLARLEKQTDGSVPGIEQVQVEEHHDPDDS